MKKIAVRSNNNELSALVIEKLVYNKIIKPKTMKPEQLTWMCYVIGKDIIVSPLCLEMHYPEYEDVYATDYLNGNF